MAETREPLLVRDVGEAKNHPLLRDQYFTTGSFISFPLVYHDELVGVVNLANRAMQGMFVEEDVDRVRLLGLVIALVASNARLPERLRRSAQCPLARRRTHFVARDSTAHRGRSRWIRSELTQAFDVDPRRRRNAGADRRRCSWAPRARARRRTSWRPWCARCAARWSRSRPSVRTSWSTPAARAAAAINTFNISTAAALLVAGAGVRVAKHGNRSFTTQCGSADVLEALGVSIDAPVGVMEAALREAGIVFMFAPLMHPAMRHVGPVRARLGVQTVMNLVGPLANPARAGRQVVGVSEPKRLALIAGALRSLDTVHALVVHGDRDGRDLAVRRDRTCSKCATA